MKAVLLPSLSYRIILKEIEGYKQAVHSCHTESRSVGWLNSKNTIDFPFQSLRKPGSRLTVTLKILTTAIHVSAQLQHKDEFGQHPTNLTSRLVSVKCKVVEWLKCVHIRLVWFFSYGIKHQHLMFSVAVLLLLARILSQIQWWSVSMVTR